MLQLNFLSAVRLTRLVIPQMQRQGGGRIIHIASIYGREWGGPTTYNASKAAMISFSKTLARQLAKDHILVNTVAPGSICSLGESGSGVSSKTQSKSPGFLTQISPSAALGALKKWRRSWCFWPLRSVADHRGLHQCRRRPVAVAVLSLLST